MPLLWTPRTIPELAAVKQLPPEERARIWGRCWPRIRRHWQFWAAAVGAAAVAVVVFTQVSPLLAGAGVPRGLLNGLFSGLAAGLPAGTLFAQVVNRVAVPYLRAELAGPTSPDTRPAEQNAAPDRCKMRDFYFPQALCAAGELGRSAAEADVEPEDCFLRTTIAGRSTVKGPVPFVRLKQLWQEGKLGGHCELLNADGLSLAEAKRTNGWRFIAEFMSASGHPTTRPAESVEDLLSRLITVQERQLYWSRLIGVVAFAAFVLVFLIGVTFKLK